MSIILTSNNFPNYREVESTNFSINNDNIILNNNLILESDFINNAEMVIRGSIIFMGGKLINRGNIYLKEKESIEYIIPFDINSDFQKTGFIIGKNVNNLILKVCGPIGSSVKWEKHFIFQLGKNSSFYFSNDGGLTSKDKIEAGDELYWNESYSNLKLYKDWKVILQIL